jgi:calcineurin-like phosphoesterase family protein
LGKRKIMEKRTFFSSDYHFQHKNIIRYDNRPFSDLTEMEEQIVKRHNLIVGENDDFYYLGDLGLGYNKRELSRMEELLWRLNGNKYFIKGNHDHKETIRIYEQVGTFLGGQKRIRLDGIDVMLNHFPMRTWDKSHHGSYHLYGHHHGDIERTPWGRSMDVGIMCNNYAPFSWEEVHNILSKREPMIIKGDHHNPKNGR